MSTQNPDQSYAQCPFHPSESAKPGLTGTEELIFPFNKRAIVQYAHNDVGALELRIFYDDKEISFDEPKLFAFGETLTQQTRFMAEATTLWGPGYPWSQIKPLLEQLLAEGVLQHASQFEADASKTPARNALTPSPLPPAATDQQHLWQDCETISQRLTGLTLPLAYLELVVPVFRIAHITLDAEGRQVGEANVFPPALRLDVETEWRTCPYPGSRYLDERPMNVTALRSMSNYWPQMMASLLPIRDAYLQRYPQMRENWTVGGIEALSASVLAVVTYPLIRSDQPLENGQLHPALASLFRVSDGLRMVTHQMMLVPVGEPTIPANTPITSREIYDYSERNYAFSSTHGVCAGPKTMIEDFLNVLINGVPSKEAEGIILEPAVLDALNDVEVALDYGLLGLQAHAAMFSIWPVMTRCYVTLAEITRQWSGKRAPALEAFHLRLQSHNFILAHQTHHATEEWRQNRERTYADIYHHAAQGLGQTSSHTSLTEQIMANVQTRHQAIKTQLQPILLAFCQTGEDDTDLQRLLDYLVDFLQQVQAIVKTACDVQQHINHLLGRQEATTAFDARLIDIHNLLQGEQARKLPFILDELETVLGIELSITPHTIEIFSH